MVHSAGQVLPEKLFEPSKRRRCSSGYCVSCCQLGILRFRATPFPSGQVHSSQRGLRLLAAGSVAPGVSQLARNPVFL